jgi:hypothetical protein
MEVEFFHKASRFVRIETEPIAQAKVKKYANAISASRYEGNIRQRYYSAIEGNTPSKNILADLKEARLNTIYATREGIERERTLFIFSKKIKLPHKISY